MSNTVFSCLDCQLAVFPASACGKSQRYMVHPSIWAMIGGGRDFYRDWLCVACMEARLGRALRPEDLLPCPVNDPRRRDEINDDIGYLRELKIAARRLWDPNLSGLDIEEKVK